MKHVQEIVIFNIITWRWTCCCPQDFSAICAAVLQIYCCLAGLIRAQDLHHLTVLLKIYEKIMFGLLRYFKMYSVTYTCISTANKPLFRKSLLLDSFSQSGNFNRIIFGESSQCYLREVHHLVLMFASLRRRLYTGSIQKWHSNGGILLENIEARGI